MKKFIVVVGISVLFAIAQAATTAIGYGVLAGGKGGGDGLTRSSFTLGAQKTLNGTFGNGNIGYAASTFIELDTSTNSANASVTVYSWSANIQPNSVSFNGPAMVWINGAFTITTATVIAVDNPGGDTYLVATGNGYIASGNVASGFITVF